MNEYKDLSEFLHSSLRYILHNFKINNNISDEEVISIKKDAIFTSKKCYNLIVDGIELVEKNCYSMMFKFKMLNSGIAEIYIKSRCTGYHIKGINKDIVSNNKEYFDKLISIIYDTSLLQDRFTILNILNNDSKKLFAGVKTFDKEGNLILNNGFKISSYNNIDNIDDNLIFNSRFHRDYVEPFYDELLKKLFIKRKNYVDRLYGGMYSATSCSCSNKCKISKRCY